MATRALRRPIRRLRWLIVGMLFLATVISYLDRQALSVNAPVIRAHLGLSNIQYSYLVTSFLVAYTIGQPLAGWLVDRLGTRLAFSVCMIWWSIAGMLHAGARSLGEFAVYRFLLGLGEAGSVPASIRGISEWFPARERSLATGVFAAGTATGVLISPPLVAFLTLQWGWRASFLVTGFFGLGWYALWRWLYFLPEAHPRIDPAERDLILAGRLAAPASAPVGIADLLRLRKPWGLVIGRFMMDPVWWFYVFWLPSYLSDVRGFSLAEIGVFGWIPFLSADAGTIFGGWLSGRVLARTGSLTRARRTTFVLGAAGTLLGIPAALAPAVWLCLALVSVVTFAIAMWATTVVTLGADILPPRAVGSMTGLSGTGAGLGGIVFTMATGWLVDRFSYFPVFVIAGTAPLVGTGLLLWLLGEIEPLVVAERQPVAR